MSEIYGTDYSVSPTKFVTGLTYGLALVFIILGTIVPFIILLDDEGGLLPAVLFTLLMAGIMIPVYYISWVYSPKKYIISERGVSIIRPKNDIVIPMEEISKVEEREFKNYKMLRKWGNGGLYSVSGKFWTKADGTFWAYGKNNNWVMIHAKSNWAVSPDERELFMTDLKGRIEKFRRRRKK